MGPVQLLHGYIYFISHTHTILTSIYASSMCDTMCISVCLLCLSGAWAKIFSHCSTLPFLVKRLPSSSYSSPVTLWLDKVNSVTNKPKLCDLNVNGRLAKH